MTALANVSRVLSDSCEYLPRISGDENSSASAAAATAIASERIPSPLLTDSAQILLVTAGYDHTIRFWDVIQGSCLATLQHNESQVNALSISPDKKLLAVAGNPNVRIFDVEETLNLALISSTSPNIQDFSASTANLQAKNILQGHTGNVTSIGFQSACQWLYTASADGALMIWDVSGLKCQREFRNKFAINSAVLHPNQAEFIIGDEAGYVKVVDLIQNSFTIEMCPEDYSPVVSVAMSENGQLLAVVNESGNLYVWQAKTAQSASNGFTPLASIKSAHSPYAIKCTFSPNSEVLVTTGADGLAKHWTIDSENKSLKLSSTLLGHSHWVWDAAFSADSSFLLTGSSDNSARLWDLDSGEVICIYSGHAKAITAVAINDSINGK